MNRRQATVSAVHPHLGACTLSISRERAVRLLAAAGRPEDVIDAVLGVLARRIGGASFRGADLVGPPLFDSPPLVLRGGFEVDVSELSEMLAEVNGEHL